MLVHCFGCEGGLDEVSAASGIPRWRLLKWPPPDELGEPVSRSNGRRGAPAPLPSEGLVGGYASALLVSEPALRWLIEGRGLTLETIERYELGYDQTRNAVTIPIRNTSGVLINLRRRFLDEDADPKIVGLARPACLYPLQVLAGEPRALVVCEGEVDALLLNQAGIPAVTSTAGTHWAEQWNPYVVGRRVAVLYDAGGASYEIAERRADEFRRAGAKDAWPVDLTLAGFRKGEDVTDWFVKYDRSAKELRAFIGHESRRCQRRERRG